MINILAKSIFTYKKTKKQKMETRRQEGKEIKNGDKKTRRQEMETRRQEDKKWRQDDKKEKKITKSQEDKETRIQEDFNKSFNL